MSQLINDRPRDCLTCRLVGGLGLVGIGLYVGFNGLKAKGKFSRIGMLCIASSAVTLGTLRLLNLPPFDKSLSSSRLSNTAEK